MATTATKAPCTYQLKPLYLFCPALASRHSAACGSLWHQR